MRLRDLDPVSESPVLNLRCLLGATPPSPASAPQSYRQFARQSTVVRTSFWATTCRHMGQVLSGPAHWRHAHRWPQLRKITSVCRRTGSGGSASQGRRSVSVCDRHGVRSTAARCLSYSSEAGRVSEPTELEIRKQIWCTRSTIGYLYRSQPTPGQYDCLTL